MAHIKCSIKSSVVVSLVARGYNLNLSTPLFLKITRARNIVFKEDNLKDVLPIHFSKSSRSYKGFMLRSHFGFWEVGVLWIIALIKFYFGLSHALRGTMRSN